MSTAIRATTDLSVVTRDIRRSKRRAFARETKSGSMDNSRNGSKFASSSIHTGYDCPAGSRGHEISALCFNKTRKTIDPTKISELQNERRKHFQLSCLSPKVMSNRWHTSKTARDRS